MRNTQGIQNTGELGSPQDICVIMEITKSNVQLVQSN